MTPCFLFLFWTSVVKINGSTYYLVVHTDTKVCPINTLILGCFPLTSTIIYRTFSFQNISKSKILFLKHFVCNHQRMTHTTIVMRLEHNQGNISTSRELHSSHIVLTEWDSVRRAKFNKKRQVAEGYTLGRSAIKWHQFHSED